MSYPFQMVHDFLKMCITASVMGTIRFTMIPLLSSPTTVTTVDCTIRLAVAVTHFVIPGGKFRTVFHMNQILTISDGTH